MKYYGGKMNDGVDWDDFDKFEEIVSRYMPARGEGHTVASQIVTAVNKLVYKWYNDGDVFDNNYGLEGWMNDLSSYANWLRTNEHTADMCDAILDRIYEIRYHSEYEHMLYDLAEALLDEKFLTEVSACAKEDSIYDCDGPYKFTDYEEDFGDDEEVF